MSSEQKSKVRRILLKISGEALSGESGFGIDPKVLSETAKAIRNVQEQGIQTVLVIGGGNIFRGAALQKAGFDRVSGDQMGMLALYNQIGENQKDTEPVTVGRVREMVDRAIDRNSRRFRFGRNSDKNKDQGLTVLHEKDFS